MSYLNTQSGDTGDPVFFAEGNFYGLKFFNENKDDLDFDRHITCIPNIHLLNSNSKILLDYTGCNPGDNSDYVDNIINGISLGQGFTLEHAKYIDQKTGVESDLSGRYTYSATFDKGIYADVVSVEKVENLDKKYSSIGFFDTFNAIFTVQNTDTTEKNTIKNSFGSDLNPSFATIGAKSGDYVKILSGTNSSTTTLHEISRINRDFNDHEIVQFGNSADFSDENRIGSLTNLRFYRIPTSSSVSASNNLILDIQGESKFVENNSITNLTGRVNLIAISASEGKYVMANLKAPTLVFSLGSVYIFNLTEDSLREGNHTLRISTTEDGKWNGGVPHPDVYQTDKLLIFDVVSSGTYYYYCENHPGMGGRIEVSAYNPSDVSQLNTGILTGSEPVAVNTPIINSNLISTTATATSSGIYT